VLASSVLGILSTSRSQYEMSAGVNKDKYSVEKEGEVKKLSYRI
jgi:hypothetical protein